MEVQKHVHFDRAPVQLRGIGGKKHYGFPAEPFLSGTSTINTSALQLEDVTVEMRDWNDCPSVDIPEFK